MCDSHHSSSDVWGDDLKADLRRMNSHWSAILSDEQREAGLNTISDVPVEYEGSTIARLWDRHSPGWRDRLSRSEPKMSPEIEKQLIEQLTAMREAAPIETSTEERALMHFDHTTVERSLHPLKGSWWQFPKNTPRRDG
jgi:hypothetical protein